MALISTTTIVATPPLTREDMLRVAALIHAAPPPRIRVVSRAYLAAVRAAEAAAGSS